MTPHAVALGMFDSVHIGHKAVLEGVLYQGCVSVAMTFDQIPYKSGGSVLTEDEKKEKLFKLGIDTVMILDFDEVKDMSPREFLDDLTRFGDIKRIACGFNFRFGKNAEGDTAFLKEYCREKNIEYFEADEILDGDVTVSTTYIKMLLADGRVEKAAELLGEEFSITSTVMEGDKRGTSLGFPTANQLYPQEKAPLKSGVYRTRVEIDGEVFDGVTDLGTRPTFPREQTVAETYIIDYMGDCYGKEAKLSFAEFLREEKRFDSKEELIKAIAKNVEYVKSLRPAEDEENEILL